MRTAAKTQYVLATVITMLLVICAGAAAGRKTLDAQLVIVVIGAVGTLSVISYSKDAIRSLLALAAGMIVLGWRAAWITPQFGFFPAEVLVWFGALLMLARRHLAPLNQGSTHIPRPAVGLVFLTISGVLVAILNSNPLGYALLEAKAFVVFLPILIIVLNVIDYPYDIVFFVKIIIASGTVISLVGLLEFIDPSISSRLPWLFTFPNYYRVNFPGGDPVHLASFSAWGGPIVATGLVLTTGLWVGWFANAFQRPTLVWKLAGFLNIFGIVISGYRSAWLGLVVVLALSFFLSRRGSVIIGGTFLAIFYFLPEGFLERVRWIPRIAETQEHSAVVRLDMSREGVEVMLRSPLGTGWASTALPMYVHNDWLHVGVSIGLFAFVLFLVWYISTLFRLWGLARVTSADQPAGWLPNAFLVSLAGYAAAMFSGAMGQVPPLMTQFWIVFCLAYRLTHLGSCYGLSGPKVVSGSEEANGETVRPITDV